MVPDERDRNFDKALARHLRSSAPLEGAASAPTEPALRRDPCPDTETLAAYHERSLLPDEMNSRKEHIIGCGHCQMILAQLEATDEIPLPATAEEKIVAMKESEAVMAEGKFEELPTLAAAKQGWRAASASQPEKTPASGLSRGVRWRWLAPAGAVAAGLLVWIAVHENRQPRVLAPSERQIARNQAPTAPLPLPPVQQRAPSPQAHATPIFPQSAADEIASSNAPEESRGARPRRKLDYEAKVTPAKPSTDKESSTRKDARREALEQPTIAANQVDLDAKAVAGAVQEKAELQTQMQARAPDVQSQNQYNYNEPKVPGPGPLGQAEAAKKRPPPPAPAPVTGRAGRLQGAASMMELVTVSNPRLIAAPGTNVIWRVGRAGLIEFSSDGGKSWSRQTSGVIADLLTGSAPSDQVCWIVGRAGTILRTTDGGAHWQKVRSPVQDDLGSVFVVDAQQATVSTAHGSYQTTDGGLTWNKLAAE